MGENSAAMMHYLKVTNIYLQNLKNDGVSVCTLRNYASRLNHFYEFMLDNGYSTIGPTFQAAFAWKNYLSMEGKSIATIRQYLAEVHCFFEWACDKTLGNPYYEKNPISKRIIPSNKKKARQPYNNLLTNDDVIKLLRNNPLAPYKGQNNWTRNYAITILLLTTGIRNAELLSLTPADLDFENGFIRIQHGKGDKYRTIQFPNIAQEAIKAYLRDKYRPANIPDTLPLFGTMADETGHRCPSDTWHQGSSQWISSLVARHVKTVTGKENVRTHKLRHVCAKTLLENGLSMEEIQAILGHENISTTQAYAGKLSPKKAGKKAKGIFEEMEYQAQRIALQVS